MNRLELKLKAHSHSDGIDYLVLEIKVDGQLLADFECYASDLAALMRSIESNGEFFILTCWCGIPECVGIKRGVKVRHENKVTYWQVQQPEPQRSFVFERAAYEQTIREVVKQGNRLIVYLASSGSHRIEITPDLNKRFFESKLKQ